MNRPSEQESTERHNKWLLSVLDQIDTHGWIVVGVFDPDGQETGFTYTIGLTGKGLPELVIYGLSPQQSQFILNDVAKQLIDGIEIKDETRLGTILAGDYDVKVRGPIDIVKAEMHQARTLYMEVQGYQILWPDEKNHFPGEEEYEGGLAPQPLMPYWVPA